MLDLLHNRRVRRLLAYIDRLPRNSYYSEAVANDPEHMHLLLEAAGDAPADRRPRMSSWSPEVEATTTVADLLRALIAITVMANSKKGAKKPDATPTPRPGTVLDEVRRERKRRKHEELKRRVLPKEA